MIPALIPALIPAVVLLGGLARRMGGGDKALLCVGEQSILVRTLAVLVPQASPLALNANGDPARLARHGLPVLPDTVPGHPGPLAGVLAAMEWAAGFGAPRVLTVAGDCPFLPPDLVSRLAAMPARVAMASSGGRHHPVVALWSTGLRDDLRVALATGERRVGVFSARHAAVAVEWPADPLDPFLNVNTPADLAEAGRIAISPCATAPATAAPRSRHPG